MRHLLCERWRRQLRGITFFVAQLEALWSGGEFGYSHVMGSQLGSTVLTRRTPYEAVTSAVSSKPVSFESRFKTNGVLTCRDDFLGLLLPGQSNRIDIEEIFSLASEVILFRDLRSGLRHDMPPMSSFSDEAPPFFRHWVWKSSRWFCRQLPQHAKVEPALFGVALGPDVHASICGDGFPVVDLFTA